MTSRRVRRISGPRQSNLSLTDFTGVSHEVRELELTRGPGAKGITLAIVCLHKEDGGRGVLDVEAEATAIVDGLLELPAETRREIFLLITQDFADAFNGVPFQKNTKTHPWPPRSR